MKVKTLLKVLRNVEYTLISTNGWTITSGFVDEFGFNNFSDFSLYLNDVENMKVIEIKTVKDNDQLYIKIA